MTQKNSNRTLVNVLGIPGILLCIYFGGYIFAAFITFASLIAITEFYKINGSKSTTPSMWIGWLGTLLIAHYYFHLPVISNTFLLFVVVTLVIVSMIVEMFMNRPEPSRNIAFTLTGILYIPLLLLALIGLRNLDGGGKSALTFAVFISVWLCDSAAFWFGKTFGKTKIFPRVSPNKTVVGTVAGLLTSIVFLTILYHYNVLGPGITLTDALVLGVITGGFGQLGDFMESLIKRDVGVKDSGTFLQGHGGAFDRFDSLIIAGPLAYFYLTLVAGIV